MKRNKKLVILLIIITLLGPMASLYSLEIGAAFQIGDLGFASDRLSTATDFPLLYPWGISFHGSQQVSETLGIDAGFYFDPVLNKVSYTLLTYTIQFFTIGVGPYFGFFNSDTAILKPGISTSVKIDFPGLVFFQFRADSSISARLVQEGDYLQERSDISAGFYVKNVIASANLFTKSYTYRAATAEVIDSFAEYSFKTDLYQKNVPYRIQLSFAYQKRSKSFTDISTFVTVAHELNSIVIGTRLDLQVADFLSIMVHLDSAMFSFGTAGDALLDLPTSGPGSYLFNVSAGFVLDTDELFKLPLVQ